jgi:hypothetical protein
MRTIYIGGGQKKKKEGGLKWKIYMSLFLFLILLGSVLKVTAPTLVERWINQQGAKAIGYAFSIRDVNVSLVKGRMVLNDLKIFHPKTNTELIEAPQLTLQINWTDLLLSQDKKISVYADKVDVILSKDFTSEIERIKAAGEKKNHDFYLDTVEGKIVKLNIIEHKEDQSRTVLELDDVNVKVKEVSLLSINKKTEFSVSSNIAHGGKLNLSGKTSEIDGSTPWSIHGTLKQIRADMFNKITGDKLPFTFNESTLNAELSAHSDHGKVIGEISPDIKRLNLVDEKPGIPTQTIARALSDELTFTLPFTLKDDLTLEYEDTYRKLKNYRKSPVLAVVTSESEPVEEAAPQAEKMVKKAKTKKAFSFWTF